jgi:hypothetical protein
MHQGIDVMHVINPNGIYTIVMRHLNVRLLINSRVVEGKSYRHCHWYPAWMPEILRAFLHIEHMVHANLICLFVSHYLCYFEIGRFRNKHKIWTRSCLECHIIRDNYGEVR